MPSFGKHSCFALKDTNFVTLTINDNVFCKEMEVAKIVEVVKP
jgi:hypothetical protein